VDRFEPPATEMKCKKLKVVVHAAEEGEFLAEIPALPRCATQGDTEPELRARIIEAAEGYLNSI